MSKLSVEEFRARRLATMADERAYFRANWRWIVLESLRDIGGGVVLGVALGLSVDIWVLAHLLRNF